jgi:hypothetical protein
MRETPEDVVEPPVPPEPPIVDPKPPIVLPPTLPPTISADMQMILLDRRKQIDVEIKNLTTEALELDTAIKIMQRYVHK